MPARHVPEYRTGANRLRRTPTTGGGAPERPLTLEAYMAADGDLRARSPEVDYGTHWRTEPELEWPMARVSWIEATGELYAVTFHEENPVEVLAVIHRRDLVEEILEGWAEGPSILTELRRRLEGWEPGTPAARQRSELARQLWTERREAILEGRAYLGLPKVSAGMTTPRGWAR